MPEVVRMGDVNDADGSIIDPLTVSVFANWLLVSVNGSFVGPHLPCPSVQIHCAATVIEGSPNVFAEWVEVVRVDDLDSCTHVRSTGSPDVLAN